MGVPSNLITPFVGVSFDSSRAQQGSRAMPVKALIMGHALSAGTLTANVPTLCTSPDDAGVKAGFGSQLHMLATKWFSRNKLTALYLMKVAENGSAAAATYDYAITGTATENGELAIYIDQQKVSVSVTSGQAATAVADALQDAIDLLDKKIAFTTSLATSTITLTSKSKGSSIVNHDVRAVYYDTDKVPAGLSVAITETGGTGAADIAGAITGMGENWFNFIVTPFADTTNINLLETEMADRAGAVRQIDGLVFFGYDDTAANTITFATNSARNSQYLVAVDAYKYPQHPSYVACLVAAEIAKSIENDPGQPVHRITIESLLPPISTERHSLSTLNTLTLNGVFTLNPHAFGGPQTWGAVTMYLKNSSGVPDTAYQYINTITIFMFLRWDFVAIISSKFARARLASSSEKIRPGIQVITPDTGKAEAISIARQWEAAGFIENLDDFKNNIICQRSASNVNRLEWILPPDLVNQFITGSGDMQFKL